jgi:hypothetical protein
MSEHPVFRELFFLIPDSGDTKRMLALLEQLATARVDIDTLSEITDATLLGKASDFGDLRAVQLLLDAGANPNKRYYPRGKNMTPIMSAANGGHVEAVELLLAAGADPNVVDAEGRGVIAQMASAFERRRYSNESTQDLENIVELLRRVTDGTLLDEPINDDAPHPLFAELVRIGSAPKISNGVADEKYFWRLPGEGIGPNRQWDARTRAIGEQLYREAGATLNLMKDAHSHVVRSLGHLAGHALSAHWTRIGEGSRSGCMWLH